MKKNNFPLYIWVIICIFTSIVSFTIGFYRGEKVYLWVITPFSDSTGRLDYGILWAAFGAIGTIFVSIVAILQTLLLNKRELIDKNTVKIIANNNTYSLDSFNKIRRPADDSSSAINEILISNESSKRTGLVMQFKYKVFNDCIPEAFYIKNPCLSYNNGSENILHHQNTISAEAVIPNRINPFLINIKIYDENIDLSKNEFWFSYELILLKKCSIGTVSTTYECLNKFNITKDDCISSHTNIQNLLTYQNKSARLLIYR